MSDITGLLNKYKGIADERFFGELFSTNEYEEARKVKSEVVIDVGALAGEFCAYIYDQAQIIYAIEPYSKHYEELENNVKEFELTKIKPFRLALSDKNGEGNLEIGTRGGNLLKGDIGEKVPTLTLATFMKQNNIEHVDVLKIDIEGNENLVFKSEDFKEVAGKIAFIIGEHLGGFENLLTGYGFRCNKDKENLVFIL